MASPPDPVGFWAWAHADPERIALVDPEGRNVTYGRLHALEQKVRYGLRSVAVASIGPTTSEELREQGIAIDIEASHPKMGFLVRDAAERAGGILRTKRGSGPDS